MGIAQLRDGNRASLNPCADARVGAVIVFYNPDDACFLNANRLAERVECVVVDNTEGPTPRARGRLAPSIHYLPNGKNEGIASALNRGVAHLKALGCDKVFLFDQDSAPDDRLLTELPQAIVELSKTDSRVALVGPAYVDDRLGGPTPFVRFAHWRLLRVPAKGNEPIETDFLISSGSCVNLHSWDEIGRLQDDLFIDFVDLEWCVRARRKGFNIYGIPWVHMNHSLGGEPIRIFGRAYPSHSAARHYYLFRNAVSLILRPDVPFSWKSGELVKLPIRLCIYALFLEPRWRHVRMACVGIVDGLRGKLGPLDR
ncbi:glycosyltransferase family 2 protein [Caballeronia novacaledonica]|uniref:Glycosyltransferase family 2 protein n=1 Tax=Caballeronia novacaledonica TaxID=1544861 RepID=A0AA37IAZ5_9BURK|nr:glycosyltransferase family 2 protein [Caballeronia novacaledonica]GJH26033.1 glycosyltransferase family 2 protein [Caballeronia novacaledonica]